MKLINSIFIFLFIVFSSCNKKAEETVNISEKPKMLVDKKTVYEFLNYNFSSKNPIFKNCENVLNRDPLPYFDENDSIALTKMDTIFSKADIEFIFKQSNYSKHFIIEKKYWRETNDKYFSLCVPNIPLFSLDKQTAIMKIGYESGWGIFVYRRENGKWKLLATITDVVY